MAHFDDLVDGYRRFHRNGWSNRREHWKILSEGQSPKAMVIACSDSRVEPAQIFDIAPGEVFVVRNIANLVPPFEADAGRHGVSAAVEFAVTQLLVPEIVVMGHGGCGGVHAAMTQRFTGKAPGEGGFIAHWVDMLDDARERILAEHHGSDAADHALELETVRVSLANLRTFPCVAEREAAGTLALHGAWFGLTDGSLWQMDERGDFAPISLAVESSAPGQSIWL